MSMCEFVHIWVQVPSESKKIVCDSLKLELQVVVSHLAWVLGTKLVVAQPSLQFTYWCPLSLCFPLFFLKNSKYPWSKSDYSPKKCDIVGDAEQLIKNGNETMEIISPMSCKHIIFNIYIFIFGIGYISVWNFPQFRFPYPDACLCAEQEQQLLDLLESFFLPI